MGPISTLLSSAFNLSRSQNAEISREWNRLSLRVGLGLPRSLLTVSIQRVGALDMLLRSIESETADALGKSEDAQDAFDYQHSLSELWIGSVYEILRVLDVRKLAGSFQDFAALFEEFTLLRIAIEKYELRTDRKIKAPIRMHLSAPDSETDFVHYLGGDPMRAHIMAGGVSARGSVMWQAVDWETETNVWLERRELSDRLIAMLATPSDNEMPGPSS